MNLLKVLISLLALNDLFAKFFGRCLVSDLIDGWLRIHRLVIKVLTHELCGSPDWLGHRIFRLSPLWRDFVELLNIRWFFLQLIGWRLVAFKVYWCWLMDLILSTLLSHLSLNLSLLMSSWLPERRCIMRLRNRDSAKIKLSHDTVIRLMSIKVHFNIRQFFCNNLIKPLQLAEVSGPLGLSWLERQVFVVDHLVHLIMIHRSPSPHHLNTFEILSVLWDWLLSLNFLLLSVLLSKRSVV